MVRDFLILYNIYYQKMKYIFLPTFHPFSLIILFILYILQKCNLYITKIKYNYFGIKQIKTIIYYYI